MRSFGTAMGDFQAVVIENVGRHYVLSQGEEVLLRVPGALFALYESDSVFPPRWRPRAKTHPVRRLFWNPETREFLMAGLEAHPVRVVEGYGDTPFRSYLQGVWRPDVAQILLRPYWSPTDPYDAFDADARRTSFEVQWRFLQILGRLMPPPEWVSILNATDPYLEVLGLTTEEVPTDGDAIRELVLTPPASVEVPAVRKALEVLSIDYVGSCFPVLGRGMLQGLHALLLGALHSGEALFRSLGIAYQEGPFRPH